MYGESGESQGRTVSTREKCDRFSVTSFLAAFECKVTVALHRCESIGVIMLEL